MKKLLAFAVIFLFFGVAVAPSIHADVDDGKLVDVTTEFCGLNRKPYTVKLTQEESEELEELFDDIKNQLDMVETREEAEEVFKEAVVELDRYDLLGSLSIERAQRLVTGGFQNQKTPDLLVRLSDRFQKIFYEDENVLCLISGRTNITHFWTIPLLAYLALTFISGLPFLFLLAGAFFFEIFPILMVLFLLTAWLIPLFIN